MSLVRVCEGIGGGGYEPIAHVCIGDRRGWV